MEMAIRAMRKTAKNLAMAVGRDEMGRSGDDLMEGEWGLMQLFIDE